MFEFGVLCSLQGYLRGFKSAQLLLGVLNMKTAGIVVQCPPSNGNLNLGETLTNVYKVFTNKSEYIPGCGTISFEI